MTVHVVFNALVFFINFVEERDTMTWSIAAAKIAEKSTNLALFHFSKVKFAT